METNQGQLAQCLFEARYDGHTQCVTSMRWENGKIIELTLVNNMIFFGESLFSLDLWLIIKGKQGCGTRLQVW